MARECTVSLIFLCWDDGGEKNTDLANISVLGWYLKGTVHLEPEVQALFLEPVVLFILADNCCVSGKVLERLPAVASLMALCLWHLKRQEMMGKKSWTLYSHGSLSISWCYDLKKYADFVFFSFVQQNFLPRGDSGEKAFLPQGGMASLRCWLMLRPSQEVPNSSQPWAFHSNTCAHSILDKQHGVGAKICVFDLRVNCPFKLWARAGLIRSNSPTVNALSGACKLNLHLRREASKPPVTMSWLKDITRSL